MNRPGVLLDTGPLVALLSGDDADHARAVRLLSECQPPLRCPEAVITEACFLMRKVDPAAPAEVISLGRKGFYEIPISIDEHWERIESLLDKYADRPISLADASLIRTAEIYEDGRILTFDSDFDIYRWGQRKKFQTIG